MAKSICIAILYIRAIEQLYLYASKVNAQFCILLEAIKDVARSGLSSQKWFVICVDLEMTPKKELIKLLLCKNQLVPLSKWL